MTMKTLYHSASAIALAAAPRGLIRMPRADVSDPKALFAQLQSAVEEMRQTHETQLAAKADDVVTNDKIDRINAGISEMQATIEEQARKLEAAKLNGGAGASRVIPDAQYSDNFVGMMRGNMAEHEVKAALNTTTDSQGGYLAPVEWDRTLTDKLIEVSPMRAIATVESISKRGFKKLANLRGTASGWVDEDDARTETATATFGEIPISYGELYANPATTQQMLDDAEVNLEAWLAGEVGTEFAKAEGVAFVSGNGTKRPRGFLGYVTGGASAGINPIGNISTVAGGHASLLNNPDKLIDLVTALPSIYRNGARFVMNRLTEGAIRLLKDTTNQYLWQPSLAAGVPSTLAGYPVTELPDMPDIAANAMPLAFGNFAAGYLIHDRTGVSVLRDPYTNKPYVHFYSTKRVGGAVVQPEALKILRIAAS
jgi:HK97 family phage major capsid protein